MGSPDHALELEPPADPESERLHARAPSRSTHSPSI